MSMTSLLTSLEIAQQLVRCPSVTPEEAGALDYLEDVLRSAGFVTYRLVFSGDGSYDVDNLFARVGTGKPHLCFAGHTDVVPAGDLDGWDHDPFCGAVIDGHLFGRGTEDMKGSIAAFTAAALDFLSNRPDFPGSLSFLITGDEEADAINGTKKLIEWVHRREGPIDGCLVGEPTNAGEIGTTIKNGRRGSLSARLVVEGVQGHVAYPEQTDNPITRALPLLNALTSSPFDKGSFHFPPTNLEITSIDVGNSSNNVVPAKLTAKLNVRFNDHWTSTMIEDELRRRLQRAAKPDTRYRLTASKPASDVFLTDSPELISPLCAAIYEVTGHRAKLSTAGGTSDARFIKNYCPVVEFGLVFETLHQVNERTPVCDIETLNRVYRSFLDHYFDAER